MSALITVDALARELGEEGELHLLDVQFALGGPPGEDLYAAEHLPGALHLPLEGALAGPPGRGGRHPLPEPAELQNALRQLGIDDGSRIVVYDQQTSLAAARAWWVLRWAGLRDVRVRDGGWAAWRECGHETTTAVPTPGHGTVTVQPGTLPLLDDDQAGAWATAGRLLDVRTPERYRGEVEPIDPVAGRIPGAVNLPMGLMLNAEGTFKGATEIRQIALAAGLDLAEPVGTSCGSGITAAQMALALHEAGIETVPYIGSWSAWIRDSDRPIARG